MSLLVDAFYNAPDCFWSTIQCFKKKPKLAEGFTEPLPPDKLQVVHIMLTGSGHKREKSRIEWDLTSQHTITWKEPITVLVNNIATTLKPGSCNLYTFPTVKWLKPRVTAKPPLYQVVRGAEAAATAETEVLSGPLLTVLKEVFLAIARDPNERQVLRLADWSGANSVLGMLVANTKPAIDMCCEIFELWPELMAMPHKLGDSGGLFWGENLFHVLAVNSQEEALCKLIKLAVDRLDRAHIKECFTSQATGPFFSGKPMNKYGGTPIGYASSFCMKSAVALYLKLAKDDKVRGFVGLNGEYGAPCELTGFLPLHAVVANGFTSMYDFLCDLPNTGLDEVRESEERREAQADAEG